MKEIRNIDLTKVNNGAHRMFMESVAKILAEYEQAIAAHPKTKMLTAEFGKLLQQEKACMGLSRTSLRTAQIAEADHERDMLFTGFKAVVRAFTKGTNPETKAAAKTIWLDIAGYRINNRMQLEQQTGVLYILTKKCLTQHAEEIELLHLTQYVTQLAASNDKVSQLLNLRMDEQTGIVKGALRATRLKMDEQFRLVVKAINARMFLNDDESMVPIADFINEMVRRYKREVIPHHKAKATDEESDADNEQGGMTDEGSDADNEQGGMTDEESDVSNEQGSMPDEESDAGNEEGSMTDEESNASNQEGSTPGKSDD
ncbi:hypothetical protein HMPREF9431_01250 [Segatella oulorum F0390]|uniref:Hemagglutinin protein HagB n=1 Tax=Segatella oulorum F0390 TaxID=702438 RepID=G1WBP9_9BACT|nr:DUF6261 family protein [Segatella oulorum]EGV31503.1 hypothetical protein HMPREF9431_01250 [Segatella oulorum F0390]